MQSLSIKRVILTFTAIGLISVSSAHAHTVTQPTPIQINKGQISTTIIGKLNPNQNEHWYQFNAASWQYALINIAPLTGMSETANVGVLHMPDGSQDGTKGGIVYQGCLPQTGNYKLRIARNLMATQGKTAGYKVEVIILPKYASESLCEYL
ncbi:hypothetical protein [Psychrobacter sp. M13]|uniref:hypothetical protein n=1 Tax=Psychrobacter sp. M13 TaxID=3067275 RepID=UPI00273A94F7|nr:hypothetical protein [Psychrobacter sp. M13]WLP94704.1 hypothetical protein Q9G97_00845 [Psychrobacter sp. M13]